MFKEVSPSNQPSKNVPFTPEKIEKTDTEKKTEEVFIEKELSGEKTEISQKKQKLLDEMNQLKFDVFLDYKKAEEIRKKVNEFIKNIESLPEEITTDSIFMKKVFDWALRSKKDDLWSFELKRSILMLMKMKSSEKILISNPDMIREIAKVDAPLVIDFFNEFAKQRPDSLLNNEEFLFFVLEGYDSIIFPKIPMSIEFKKRIFAKNPKILDETMKEILKDSKKLKNYLLEYQPKPIVNILDLCKREVVDSLVNDKDLREYILKGIANCETIQYSYILISGNTLHITNHLFKTENLDENEILKLAKIHPAFIPKKFEKDKDFIFQMIKEAESPIFYFSKYLCKLDLSDDLVIKAVKITPKVLLIPAFNNYIQKREVLQRKLKKVDISSVLYFIPRIFEIDDIFKNNFRDFLNFRSDTELDLLEKEALSYLENEEKKEYLSPPYFRKPTENEEIVPGLSKPKSSVYFLSAIRDVKLKRSIKTRENIFFKFDKS